MPRPRTDHPPRSPAAPRERTRRGREAERIAARYLEGRGFTIVGRNERIGEGELDLVAEADGLILVVEVRSRWRGARITPEGSVGPDKRRRVLHAAATWLARQGREGARVRVDVIALERSRHGWLLRHHEGALVDSSERDGG